MLKIGGTPPRGGGLLHFEVKLAKLRIATKEEIFHGHVNVPYGHNH